MAACRSIANLGPAFSNARNALGAAIGLGYVPCRTPGETTEELLGSTYQIEIAGRVVEAEASLAPMYDPKSERPKA